MKTKGDKMKKTSGWQTILGIIILLGIGGLLAWGIVKLWLLFWDYISHSKPEIGAAIIAASGTIIVSVLSVVLARWIERNKELDQKRREVEQEIRKQYLPIYQELIVFLFKLFNLSKTGKTMTEEEVSQFFSDFTQKTLVWGSDKFLKDFSIFRDSSVAQAKKGVATPEETAKIAIALENLLYSIRAECGHENKGLSRGDLLVLFINDIRNYIND